MTRPYEIALYNAEVRRLVYEGEHHRQYPDSWADTHYIEIEAENEAKATDKIKNKYPPDRGFVIERVQAL
ncbi:conserved hypothetical protein [Rhodospirillaceae bacterium LM-1]|nr:conserved hypothetical protein [Rhodospirillaceae bacterium LM-1]